jgi:hypothetical protein
MRNAHTKYFLYPKHHIRRKITKEAHPEHFPAFFLSYLGAKVGFYPLLDMPSGYRDIPSSNFPEHKGESLLHIFPSYTSKEREYQRKGT